MNFIDKKIEQSRYDDRANREAHKDLFLSPPKVGSELMLKYLQEPYLHYENEIKKIIKHDQLVLELGAGSGAHSSVLVSSGAAVTLSDISEASLRLLEKKFQGHYVNFNTAIADIEDLPFADCSFDLVVSAGSLSYGDMVKVDSEILRVLRPGGSFVCVDSLNHNPIYRFNRWLHYLRSNRTKSTLINMPTIERVENLSNKFASSTIAYFGSISYIMPVFSLIFGMDRATKLSRWVDKVIRVERSAFKFVLMAKGLEKF